MRITWLLLIVFFFSSLAVQPAQARKKIHGAELRGMVVTSVDNANNKIVLTIEHNQQSVTYLVPLGTMLTLDGEPAHLSQIDKGMHVVSYTEADAATLSQLDVTNNKNAK